MHQLKDLPAGGRYQNGRYDVRFIKEIVQSVELGTPIHVICATYKMEKKSVRNWIAKYGSAAYIASKRPPAILRDKIAVAHAIAAGSFSIKEAAIAHRVSDRTIKKWHKTYAAENNELSFYNPAELSKKKGKQTTDTHSDQVLQLQHQLADAQLKITALNTLIDVAEEQLKINIRKKPGARQS